MIGPDDYIIAHCTEAKTRHEATSGGVGSCILKELFKNESIKSAISYVFDSKALQYTPTIIYDAEAYSPCGSIYHEIPLLDFIKKNIGNITSPFLCFALPCQISPIKNLLNRHNIDSFIIELTCSSQQTHEATGYLLSRANINSEEIQNIRYRGLGWPSGINITLKDGKNIFFDNNNSLWTKIFHSHLFIMPRCFFCSPIKQTPSDIQIADPWGIDNPMMEKEGRTICYIKSEKAAKCINWLHDKQMIAYERIQEEAFYNSQIGTIIRKNFNIGHMRLTRITRNLFQSSFYRRVVLKHNAMFSLHCMIYKVLFRCLYKVEKSFRPAKLKRYK